MKGWGMSQGLIGRRWAFIKKKRNYPVGEYRTAGKAWQGRAGQDKNAADKNTKCVHTTRHMDRRAHGRANSRLHAHKRQNMGCVLILPCLALPCLALSCQLSPTRLFFFIFLFFWSVQIPTRTETQEMSESEYHAPTRNKARRRECARLEHTRSRTHTWKQDKTGVSGLYHKTHEWRQTKVTEPWHWDKLL